MAEQTTKPRAGAHSPTGPSDRVDCVVTSPPYWGLRDYGGEPGQIGIEATPTEFLLAKSPRYWSDLDAVREPVTSSARARSWADRRANGAPSRHGINGAVGDSDFAANPRGRNPGDVWACSTAGFPGAHFAVMPEWIAGRCILAGCRLGGVVLDPFAGSGTTGMVATRLGRRFVGVELHRPYLELALRTCLAQSALVEEMA